MSAAIREYELLKLFGAYDRVGFLDIPIFFAERMRLVSQGIAQAEREEVKEQEEEFRRNADRR